MKKKLLSVILIVAVLLGLSCILYLNANKVYTNEEVISILDSKGIKYITGIAEEGYKYEGCPYYSCSDKQNTYIRILSDTYIQEFKNRRKEIKDMEQSEEVRYYVMGIDTYAYIEGYGMYTILTVYTLKGNVLIECSESGSHIDSNELLEYANNILK